MTKLFLRNTVIGKTEAFDTVDAKEALEATGTIYSLIDPQPPTVGPEFLACQAAISLPQLHGDEPGTSKDRGISKYARAALTKDIL